MSNENFCTWTDANAFMRACLDVCHPNDKEPLITTAQRLESPLEVVMLSAIKVAANFLEFQDPRATDMLKFAQQERHITIDTSAAVPVGTYRADLVIHAKLDNQQQPFAPVVIECDGFNYHDKTREQAVRDRQRDRYMQKANYLVARFAGDEIVEQPLECAFEVYDLALRGMGRVLRTAQPEHGWPVFLRGNDGQDAGPMTLAQYWDLVDFQGSVSEAK